MTKKTKQHKYICENCNLELKAFCTSNHTYVSNGLGCYKVEKLYFEHIRTNKDCLNKWYEILEKRNISLLKKGADFQIRFTGKRTISEFLPKKDIDRLREKHNILLDKELDGTTNK
jgi:hypothetical protein